MRRLTPARLRVGAMIVTRVAKVYARQPSRLADLPRWIRERHVQAIDARIPWWSFAAIEAMRRHVVPGMKVFEYGGGGSSVWLQDLGADLTVVEHDREWYEELRRVLKADASVLLKEPTDSGTCGSRVSPNLYFDDYVNAINDVNDDSLDLVLVDGRSRVACGLAAMSKVKHGGLLVLDDSGRSRYVALREALAEWPGDSYRGVGLGIGPPRQTTIWRKP